LTNLDLLRSLAVAFVVVSHVPPAFLGAAFSSRYNIASLGLEGVLIFFVHTSLVLMLSLERQRAAWGARHFYSVFLVRRIFRIYPLSVSAVCIVQLLASLGVGDGFRGHPRWFAYDLLLIQNIMRTVSKPQPLWSLPFEMQMYLLLPLLFLLVTILGRSAWVAIAGVWLMCIALAMAMFRLDWRYDMVKYIPCFVPGVLAYSLSRRRGGSIPAGVLFGAAGMVALIFPALVARGVRQQYLGPLICLLLGVLIPFCSEIKNTLLSRAGKVIARYSYGVYLTHLWAYELAFDAGRSLPLLARIMVFSVCLCVLAAAAYHLIEQPGMRLGKRVVEWMQCRVNNRSVERARVRAAS
jgi:peptidoglycan/LPS O-acetylase OafA/YrhL